MSNSFTETDKSFHRMSFFYALLFLFVLSNPSLASELLASFEFCDEHQRAGGYGVPRAQAWTISEKSSIRFALRMAVAKAEGVAVRATAYRPVKVFRTGGASRPMALAMAVTPQNAIYVTDLAFQPRTRKNLTDSLVHEMAHLVDVVSINECDPEWIGAVYHRLEWVHHEVARRGGKYFTMPEDVATYRVLLDESKRFYKLAERQGIPSLYGCKNLAESLAVFVEARARGFRPPAVIQKFLADRYFSLPYRKEPDLQQIHQALELHVTGQYDDALEIFNRLLTEGRFSTLYRFRAMLWKDKREYKKGIEDLTQSVKTFQHSPNELSLIYGRRAQMYELDRDRDRAIADLGRAMQVYSPLYIYQGMARAQMLYRHQKYDTAIEQLTDIIQQWPRQIESRMLRARYFIFRKTYEEAFADLNTVIKIKPKYIEAYRQRINIYRKTQQLDKAEEECTRILAVDPKHQSTWVMRSDFRKQREVYREAISDLDQAIVLSGKKPNKKNVYLFVKRAICREQIKDFAGAADDYGLTLGVYSTQDHLRHNSRGLCYLKLANFEMALAEFEAAIGKQPRHFQAYYRKAWILATCPLDSIRDGSEAFAVAEKACEMTSFKHCDALEALAAACAEMGEFAEAVDWQKKAIEHVRPNSSKQEMTARLAIYEDGNPFRDVVQQF